MYQSNFSTQQFATVAAKERQNYVQAIRLKFNVVEANGLITFNFKSINYPTTSACSNTTFCNTLIPASTSFHSVNSNGL
ncbi:hypothetical protein [Lonepinella koalarum]|uniref:hypothetical protein n=1 Tax=Lonepinella koalarum TaxID=53417 RepID=UPI001FB50F59|nr:hypothetical protein [Lonepinella koalarum]